mmetsp:Transcript_50719/g.99363  ORF Transcript_50719/g.99363 Transcript_50719/m.99363 type:complete len:470 (+) Transcript_50719:29-1438(+)
MLFVDEEVKLIAGALVCSILLWLLLHHVRQQHAAGNEDYPYRGLMKLYGLSTRGFLPESSIEVLDGNYFAPWENMSVRLPALLEKKEVRAFVDSILEELDATKLKGKAQQRRAYVLLGQVVHAYVFGQEPTLRCIPPQLARPWVQVCQTLGLPFILTAPGLDLWNCELIERDKGCTLGNLRLLSSVTGTKSECGFHALPHAMHARANKNNLLFRVFCAPMVLKKKATQASLLSMLNLLKDLKATLDDFYQLFKEVGKHVNVSEFYDIYRPLLGSFAPEGVILEGAADLFQGAPKTEFWETQNGDVRVKPDGPSAGQSTMFVVFDKFLSIVHPPGSKAQLFQANVLKYMPTEHRAFAADFAVAMDSCPNNGSIISFAQLSQDNSKLKTLAASIITAHGDCVDAYAKLRKFHLGVACSYLKTTTTGTGGTHFRNLLADTLENTQKAKLVPAVDSNSNTNSGKTKGETKKNI